MSFPSVLQSNKSIQFTLGNRTYFVTFHLQDSYKKEQGFSIVYGATIFKGELPMSNQLIYDHFQTSKERYQKFPVKAIFNNEYEQWLTLKNTRASIKNLIYSKRFKTRLVSLFCQHGVRHRPNGQKSLKQTQYLKRLSFIKKITNRHLAHKQSTMGKYKYNETTISYIELTLDQTKKIQTNYPYFIVFEEAKRIIHIVYHRFPNGNTVYGACVFHPQNQSDYLKYDSDEHINTAHQRMKLYPVVTNIPSSMQYATRSTYISEFDKLAITKLRKAIGKYGVRNRSKNGRSPDFISPHIINTQFHIINKQLNRQKGLIQREIAQWKLVRTL